MKINKYKQEYEHKGFVVIKKVFSKFEIKKLLTELEEVKKKVIKTSNNKYFHKTSDGKFNTIHNIQVFHKKGKIIQISKKKKLRNIVEKLLGDKARVRNIEFFLKPKKTGLASPFHQDNYYWNIISAKALNVWIACSVVNKANGGICYFSDSHKLGTINHKLSYSKGSSQMIPSEILSKLRFKKNFPKLNEGDCLIHHPEVIHGSFKNTSKNDRIGFVVSFESIKAKINRIGIKNYEQNLKKNLSKLYN